jgi:hypothetical protein
MPAEDAAELADLRRRLAKARGMLEQQAVLVTDARALLARDSTWPRPREIVQGELERAVRFDVPTLLEVIVQSERRIAELEQAASPKAAAESHEP